MTMPLPIIPPIETASVLVASSLVWVSAIVQHLTNTIKRGTRYVMSDRSVAPDMEGFFGRATRTLSNNIESGLMYVPPMLLLIALGHTNLATEVIAAVYIAARCAFAIAYWFKLSSVRSVFWLTGIVCCAGSVLYAVLAIVS